MPGRIEAAIQEITPPLLFRFLRAMKESMVGDSPLRKGKRPKNSKWYDAKFATTRHFHLHYTQSNCYFLWTVLSDRIARANKEAVLELGCGSGNLACLLRDQGLKKYQGIDFSSKRIEHARKICPEFEFADQDVFQSDLLSRDDYDAVICSEFLEHVEEDIELIHRLKPGIKFYATVPNFPFASHVRHFNSSNEVFSRYQHCLSGLKVDTFLANEKGRAFYLFEGETQ